MVDGAGGLDELLGPGYRLIILDQIAEEPRVGGDGGGASRSPWSAAQRNAVRRLASSVAEPFVGLALAGAVPQGHDVGFASGEVPRVGGPYLRCGTRGDELFLGELADRLQHRESGPPRRAVGDQQRLAHQRVEQIQGGEVIIGTHDRTSTLEVESTREHRTPLQQRLFRVVELGRRTTPPHGAVCGGVPGRAATPPAAGTADPDDHAPRSAVIDAIREAASSMANGIPSRRRQISTTAAASSGRGHREARRHAAGAFDEQAHRGRVDSRADVQRGHRPQLLVGDPQILHGWWPTPSRSPSARGWPRPDRRRRRERARSCRTPTAGPCPPERRPPTRSRSCPVVG